MFFLLSFMICCEKCHEWYHGKCVGITSKAAKGMSEDWLCYWCMRLQKVHIRYIKSDSFSEILKEVFKVL